MVETHHRAGASEIKFVVDAALAGRIRAWARQHLGPDPHGGGPSADEYRTASLYFDTVDFDVFQRRGSFGRAKYRIRHYGDNGTVFLERKLRKPNVLIKRRTPIPIDDLTRLADPSSGEWAGRWLQRRIAARRLLPMCQVSYSRTARGIDTPAGPARLTIDQSLSALPIEGIGFRPGPGTPFLDGRQIVELKFRSTVPAIFKRLIEEMVLSPATVSKYRLGMTAAGRAPGDAPAAPSVPGDPGEPVLVEADLQVRLARNV
jgi:hypothetical protein